MRRVCVPLYDVRRYVCSMTHACTYLSMTYACTSAHAHTRTRTCVCVCMYMHMHMYVYMHVQRLCLEHSRSTVVVMGGASSFLHSKVSSTCVCSHICVYSIYAYQICYVQSVRTCIYSRSAMCAVCAHTHIRSAMCGVCAHTYISDLLCAECAHIHMRICMCACTMYRSVHMYM